MARAAVRWWSIAVTDGLRSRAYIGAASWSPWPPSDPPPPRCPAALAPGHRHGAPGRQPQGQREGAAGLVARVAAEGRGWRADGFGARQPRPCVAYSLAGRRVTL